MINKIDHIGIVVKDLEKAINIYNDGLGLKVKLIEKSDEFQVKVAFIPVGEMFVEFLQPIGPGMINDFLESHGEGIHHICYRVSDIDKALEKVGKKINLRDKIPRPGGAGSRVAFLDPENVMNVETEFVEREKEILT